MIRSLIYLFIADVHLDISVKANNEFYGYDTSFETVELYIRYYFTMSLRTSIKISSEQHFKFHSAFEENSSNGLLLNTHYIPEEVIVDILSYLEPKPLLHLTLVCKKWCNIIKSDHFWFCFYNKRYPNKAKPLPWYVYYSYFTTNNFINLLQNTSGKRKYAHWKILNNDGDKFKVESIPLGSDPLPCDIKDFNRKKRCIATSYGRCRKIQVG